MNITRSASLPTGASVSKTKEVSADATVVLGPNYAIPANQTNLELALSLDVSQIRAIHIESDVDMTLEFNDSTTGTPTINLKANIPYQWLTNDYNALLLNTDVTKVYVTNTTAGVLTIMAEYDASV